MPVTTIRPLEVGDDLAPELDLRHRAFGPVGPGRRELLIARAQALGARGFAALFAGVPMATLRVAGLAVGGTPAANALLDSAFACTPFMLDVF